MCLCFIKYKTLSIFFFFKYCIPLHVIQITPRFNFKKLCKWRSGYWLWTNITNIIYVVHHFWFKGLKLQNIHYSVIIFLQKPSVSLLNVFFFFANSFFFFFKQNKACPVTLLNLYYKWRNSGDNQTIVSFYREGYGTGIFSSLVEINEKSWYLGSEMFYNSN